MRTNTSDKIVKYIQSKGQASAKELVDYLGITRQALFKHLTKLLAKEDITKIGKPPKVFYLISDRRAAEVKAYTAGKNLKKIIDENYLIITPRGEKKQGWQGFIYWCDRNNLDTDKTAKEYAKTLKKYDHYKKNGFIDGMAKFKNTFSSVYLDYLYYLDFYSIERFGKTKLGQTLLYGKQSGNKKLIKDLTLDIKPRIDYIIKKHKINAVGFIPPTVKREVQFMKELKKNLNLTLKNISIVKIKTEIIVPQKTLSKLADRIENAKNTIIVNEPGYYKNILLLDDAVGSGATMNETAKQIKNKKIGKKIIGLAITGSFKGFDVISEV